MVLLRGVVRKLLGSKNYIFQARGWYRKIQDWLQKKESYQRRLRGSVSSSPMVLLLSEFPFPDWSPGELLFRAQDLSFGEIICLYYVHHVTAKFKTLFPYGGFSLTYAWFTNGSISQFGLLGRGSPKRVRYEYFYI